MKIYNLLIYGFSILMLILCTNLSAQDSLYWKNRLMRGDNRDADKSIQTVNDLVLLSKEFDPGTAVWTYCGPHGGYVNSIAIAPSNPSTMYIGTITGIYKSTDGGENWLQSGFKGINVELVKIHPTSSDIVYVGAKNKFFKSIDGGVTWTEGTIDNVLAIATDYNSPQMVWVGTENGRIHKSVNGGDSFTEIYHHTVEDFTENIFDVPINSIVVAPENSLLIYAGINKKDGVHANKEGFLRSMDGGETWSAFDVGRTYPGDFGESLVITPPGYEPQTLYIISNNTHQQYVSLDVFKSTDKGQTWQPLELPWGEARSLMVDPAYPNQLYIGCSQSDYPFCVFDEIKENEQNLFLLGYNAENEKWYALGHNLPFSVYCIAAHPDSSSGYFVGNFREVGIFKLDKSSFTWHLSNKGIDNIQINDIKISPHDSHTAFAATSGGRIEKTINMGATWSNCGRLRNVNSIAIDPSNSNIMFAGTIRIFRSEDEGNTWKNINAVYSGCRQGDIEDIWISPNNPNIILASANSVGTVRESGLYRTTDGGTTDERWDRVSSSRPSKILSDPTNPDIVYGLIKPGGSRDRPRVQRFEDAGLTYVGRFSFYDYEIDVRDIYDIVFDLNSKLFMATCQGVFQYSWEEESLIQLNWYSDINPKAIAIDLRTNPPILYVGTEDFGVFVSQDGGESWSEFNNGLGITNIDKLEISSTEPKILYAGTEYGGVWRIDITTGVESKEMKPHVFHLSQNYPNPFNPSTTIQFSVPERVNVKLTLYNMLGQEVARLAEGEVEAGTHEITFDASHLSSGVYIYRLQAGEYMESRKMLYLK